MNATQTNRPVIDSSHPILLFDGVCNLCDGLVQFIIKRDPEGKFRFASLQSEVGRELSEKAGLHPENLSTAILYEEGVFHYKSDMALGVAERLPGAWKLFRVFRIIPKGVRDQVYDWVARNRYRWFGKKDHCMMPTPELKSRFLDS